ncbi:exported protein (PHISTa) [Plasmodium gaboni]|uniref:Exported protein (PHISTa) n=1 Tax=Plasmodium gaboni TaxID=647221 RepID=A0A151L2J7_9APIC|nr:exported protein (PHISTa) [Plasmodium gaboni]KYN93114.1 exported protein (PHISTa) [Plasmodium gaboni]SOV20583.1 Plasmodium exported protein (PHISTa), unknown, putative [Plasmodium sp. DRC-Itaito]
MKCKIHCRSFIFISICLCVISLFYISLSNLYEVNIVPSIKCSVIISRNLSEFENENSNNTQRKNTKNHLEETNERTSNSCNNKGVTLKNKGYNDISKNLTEKELFDVLNSLEECPPLEDLKNIWSHTLGVAKEGLDDILKELKAPIKKNLDNDNYLWDDSKKRWFSDYVCKKYRSKFCQSLIKEEVEYTKTFFSLINGKHTLDEILKFIYSYLEYFQILKKELYEEYKEKLLKKLE